MIPLVMFKRHPEPSRLERMSQVWDACRAPVALPMLFPEGFWPALFSLLVVLCNVEAAETRSVWCCLRKHRSLWYLREVVTGVVIGSFLGECVLVEDSLGNYKALERQKGKKKVYYGWVDLLCRPFLPACVGSQAPGQTKVGYLVFCWVFSLGTGLISQFFISSLVEQQLYFPFWKKGTFVGASRKVALGRSRARNGTSWEGRGDVVGWESSKGPEANGDVST